MRPVLSTALRFLRSWGVAIWLVVIASCVAWSLANQSLSPAVILQRVGIVQAAISLCLILLGKFLTILLVQNVLAAFDEPRGLKFAWYAYSLADVAKYLPGGIWGITGRLHILHRAGIQLRRGGHMLLIETLILMVFSFAVGAWAIISARLGHGYRSIVLALLILIGLTVFVRFSLPRGGLAFWLRNTVQQVLAWICFGGSFAVVAASGWCAVVVVSGIFNVGFTVGMLAVFAPSGIGVREAVIAWLGGESMRGNIRLLVELAIVHRFIWVVADFLTLLPALFFSKAITSQVAGSSPDA